MRRRTSPKTAAFNVFDANLNRSRAFLRIFDKDRTVGQPSNDDKELLRGSLVFAVGALDAYLSDLVLEIVPKHGPKSPDLSEALKAIAKSDPALSLRVALASDADKQTEFQDALGDWLDQKAFHGPQAVAMALGYVGCPITWPEFDAITKRQTASELDKATQQRHDIVHRGKKPFVTRKMAGEVNDLIEALAKHIDTTVCARYH